MASSLSPLWRFLITDLGGVGITLLDHLASDRVVTPKLNEPLEVAASVPSDSPYVNGLRSDGYPAVAEGVRQLYCFRREHDTAPYYKIRASTLIMQVDDAAHSDDGTTRITAYDPWLYLFSRPVLTALGKPLPAGGSVYSAAATADVIIMDLLDNASLWADLTAPAAAQEMFIDRVFGTIETCSPFPTGWVVQQGTSVGQAILDLVSTGYCDVVLTPIYDTAQPGILCTLNIYTQTSPANGAGIFNYSAGMAWDMPGRSVVGVDNLYDGTSRANVVQYFNGQGGPPVAKQKNTGSVAIYGEYWTQQFFPAQTKAAAVVAIAAEQLALRKTFKETLTLNPAPERAPQPFVDYYLGDRLPVYVSSRLRQALPGAALTFAWQRVYGIPCEIDDNGVETVRELIVGPVGGPPPVKVALSKYTGVSVAASGVQQRRRNKTKSLLKPPTKINP